MSDEEKSIIPTVKYREIGKNSLVRKINEYRAYVMWYSLPSTYRGLDKEDLIKLNVPVEYHDLMEIRTNTEFSNKYKVRIDTLKDWRRLPQFDVDLVNLIDKDLFVNFYARVAREFTLKTIEHGDAQRFALWMQKFAGHVEKTSGAPLGSEDETDVVLPDEGTNIMKLVLADIANEQNISESEMDEIMSEVEDAVIVDESELPSTQVYDFDKIQKIHLAKKAAAAKFNSNGVVSNGVTQEQKDKEKAAIVASVKVVAKKGIIKIKKPTNKKVVKKKKLVIKNNSKKVKGKRNK